MARFGGGETRERCNGGITWDNTGIPQDEADPGLS